MTRLICSDILKWYEGVQRETAACVSLADYIGVSFAASTLDATNFNQSLHQVIFALVFERMVFHITHSALSNFVSVIYGLGYLVSRPELTSCIYN
jgi:hypothetical protein